MREEELAVISLPDRLAHVWEAKLHASPASAPSMLEYCNHDVRQGSTGSYSSDLDSRSCCSFYSYSSHNPEGAYQKDHNDPIRPNLENYFGAVASPDVSLMPQYKTYQGLEHHSGRLLSQMPPAGGHLLPQVTMRPEAKLSEMRETSTARKIANLHQQEVHQREDSLDDLLLHQEPSEEEPVASFDGSTASTPSICLRKRTVAPEMPYEPPPEYSIEEEGEEHTLGNFEDTIASDSLSSSSLSGESVIQKRPSPPWFEQELLQPSLRKDPTGLMFAFDRMLDCFDRSQDHNTSPQTLDTSHIQYFDDEIPDFDDDGIDWFLSCWKDDLDDFADLEASTVEGDSIHELQSNESETVGSSDEELQELHSKGSLLLESDDSDSLLEILLQNLELEPQKNRGIGGTISTTQPADKYDWGDETVATEGDSTLISAL